MLITSKLGRIRSVLKAFMTIELAIICFSIAIPVVFLIVPTYPGSSAVFFVFKILFLGVSFISGFLTGSQFPLAVDLYLEKSRNLSQTAGLLYASDLLGGCLAGIAGAVVLLPILGLTGTCLTIGLLKLASLTVISTQQGRQLLGRQK